MALSDPSNPVEIPRQRLVEKLKPSASFFALMKQRFSKLRPAWNQSALPMDGNEEILQSTSLIESIYDSDFSRRMRDKYQETVRQYERVAEDPTWQASRVGRQRYMDSQHEMAKWAMKEIGRDQLQDLKERYHSGRGVLEVVKDVRGNHFERQQAEIERQKFTNKEISEEERVARVHRRDSLDEDDDEEIPTRFKTKLNPLKARGAVSMQSSVVSATVEGGGTGDKLAVELSREFQKLEMRSRARYNVDAQYFYVNVVKRITKEVAVDLSSERWTGEKRGASGEKANDAAKVIYNVSF